MALEAPALAMYETRYVISICTPSFPPQYFVLLFHYSESKNGPSTKFSNNSDKRGQVLLILGTCNLHVYTIAVCEI